jgi:hypothetical protein
MQGQTGILCEYGTIYQFDLRVKLGYNRRNYGLSWANPFLPMTKIPFYQDNSTFSRNFPYLFT